MVVAWSGGELLLMVGVMEVGVWRRFLHVSM